jgi:hypothetical protein
MPLSDGVSRQVSREHCCGMLFERINCGAIVMRAGRDRWHLLAADNHHQEFIQTDQRDRSPRPDSSADQTMA